MEVGLPNNKPIHFILCRNPMRGYMTTSDSGDTQKQIYENLISIAQLHWSYEAIEKMLPQIIQTANNLNQIIRDIPESDIEP